MTYIVSNAVDGVNSMEKIDLCYMDPPYNTGRDFYNFDDRFSSSQEYRDGLIRPVVEAIHSKLSKKGVLVIHVEPRISHHIRVVCDDVFGENRFVNEIVWKSGGNHNTEKKLQRSHDTIIVYSKNSSFTFNPEYKPYDEEDVKNSKKDDRGYYQTSALKNSQPDVTPRLNLRYEWNGNSCQWFVSKEKMQELHDDNRLEYNSRGIPRVKRYFHELKGIQVKDVWDDISQIQMGEKMDYATQKPVKLLMRIIRMFSNKGDVVCDPFGGSGTTGRASIQLDREYTLFDINPKAKELFDESVGGQIIFG
jgi:DNA modification methylase